MIIDEACLSNVQGAAARLGNYQVTGLENAVSLIRVVKKPSRWILDLPAAVESLLSGPKDYGALGIIFVAPDSAIVSG